MCAGTRHEEINVIEVVFLTEITKVMSGNVDYLRKEACLLAQLLAPSIWLESLVIHIKLCITAVCDSFRVKQLKLVMCV